ncbi:hypothetical protein [Aeromonas phage SW69-9]|uniref:Macro domain-containing protein n=2 Tax=Biquartavirus 44RR2 TaxID=115987 RepID=Q6U9J8_9CAUD|nr:Tk.4 [Aeromonas phage 44RR2.8t]APU00575.1 hypothetical protein [Aeromonas phage 44RR2.8t.2]APU01907.1 hypothetical protein [Aeromonas phage L9-6]APU02157.1 hypothetical protein [Aeromonas phage Riv-10]APU02404.1 hypothetical protein [Aeromonas phage SW69-9]AAQ81423.1 hypothetical protein [Aeromonas phage 44RR2.8t]
MIVQYVKGNAISLFLEGKYDIFGHGCNIFNRMGSGIAKEVRERLPQLYVMDLKTVSGDRNKLGTIQAALINVEGRTSCGVNMYTQATFWDPTDMLSYDAVRSTFTMLNDSVAETSVGGSNMTMCIPMIGAGLARGDWSKISAIIDEVTPNIDITVVEFDGSK